MIITYLRSSSYGTWSFCPHKYFIEYNLGIRDIGNKKAEKGTVVHKVFEVLAGAKQAMQNSATSFNDDVFGLVYVEQAFSDVNSLIRKSFEHYSSRSNFSWDNRDFDDCFEWTWRVLEFRDGMFDPRKRKIIAPERHFDFVLDEPWANYEYTLPDGEKLAGKLSIKGTIDLITEISPKIIEIVDWKTGLRKDWATGLEKTNIKLQSDPQLRIYHYAASRLYPDYDQIIITIYWIRDGGPFTIAFDKTDLATTMVMLKHRFDEIRRCQLPTWIRPDWKCDRLCYFNKLVNPGKRVSLCQEVRSDLIQIGMSETLKKHRRKGHEFGHYESPG